MMKKKVKIFDIVLIVIFTVFSLAMIIPVYKVLVDYFDFYLMHAQNADNFKKFKACRAYETAFALKAEGRIRHVGLSFHDRAEVLDQILTEYPQIEVVQIQFNYLDYDDIAVQSRKCYEVCRKHGKPVLVMEPVKGGSLVNLPEEAKKVLDDLHGGSPASYAIRFAAGFPGMMMVLLEELELVIIDEISMVRADIIDAVDRIYDW